MGNSRDSWHKCRKTGGKRKQHRTKRKNEFANPPTYTKLGPQRILTVSTRGDNKYRALSLDTGNYDWGSEGITHKTRIIDVVYSPSNNEMVRTKTLVKNNIVTIDAAPFRQWYEAHYSLPLARQESAKLSEDEEAAKLSEAEETAKLSEAEEAAKLSEAEEAAKLFEAKLSEAEEAAKLSEAEEAAKLSEAEEAAKLFDASEAKLSEAEEAAKLFKAKLSEAEEAAKLFEAEEAALNKKHSKETLKEYLKRQKTAKVEPALLEKRQKTAKVEPALLEQFKTGRVLACISSRPGQCGRADGYILEGTELEFYLEKIKSEKSK